MIGEVINVDGVDLLTLDIINGKPFVIAFNLNDRTSFDYNGNNYRESYIREITERWLKNLGFIATPRSLNLTSMDGSHEYGEIEASVAPLTFDEYRKYSSIIKPFIQSWFWTVTPSTDSSNAVKGRYVCAICGDGCITDVTCTDTSGQLMPAFLLDKQIKRELSLDKFLTNINIELLERKIFEKL